MHQCRPAQRKVRRRGCVGVVGWPGPGAAPRWKRAWLALRHTPHCLPRAGCPLLYLSSQGRCCREENVSPGAQQERRSPLGLFVMRTHNHSPTRPARALPHTSPAPRQPGTSGLLPCATAQKIAAPARWSTCGIAKPGDAFGREAVSPGAKQSEIEHRFDV